MTTRDLFFKDIAQAISSCQHDYVELLWKESSDISTIIDPDAPARVFRLRGTLHKGPATKSDVAWIARKILVSALHDFLVIIDGGTEMADTTVVKLVDDNGDDVGEGLHEHLFEYLEKYGV